MNGSQPPEAQQPTPESPAGTNGHSNNSSSSLAAKKRKKDGLKPIITMEGSGPQTPGQLARSEARGERAPPALGFFCISDYPVAGRAVRGMWQGHGHRPRAWAWAGERLAGIDIGNEIGPRACLIAYYSADCDWPELGPGYPKESPSSGPNPSLIKRATALHS
ncbi:hypothetical protein BKA56DRAFT_620548 [Ilyonectria sp. MPI-CAGE-AT-0026]|nr:hypothetical protein BKA56DRAFT_620548 [Ilyonectria sp. MPI-CAGE-AT-0026]